MLLEGNSGGYRVRAQQTPKDGFAVDISELFFFLALPFPLLLPNEINSSKIKQESDVFFYSGENCDIFFAPPSPHSFFARNKTYEMGGKRQTKERCYVIFFWGGAVNKGWELKLPLRQKAGRKGRTTHGQWGGGVGGGLPMG